jgi:hypothetical protein
MMIIIFDRVEGECIMVEGEENEQQVDVEWREYA